MAIKAISSPTAPLTTEQAAAAIVGLINARPTSPRLDEIEAIIARADRGPAFPGVTQLSKEQAQLFEAIQVCRAAEQALNAATDLPADEHDAVEAHFIDALHRVEDLSEQLPTPTRSITDIVLRAQVVYCLAHKTNGRIGLDSDDPHEVHAARLIEAVLQFAGVKYH